MRVRTFLMFGLALSLLPCSLAGKSKEQKAAEAREKEKKTAAKNERTYEKLKQFSMDLYESDPDFKDAVDRRYESIQQQHSDEAFRRNVSRRSDTIAVYEDRFRYYQGIYDNLVIQDYVNRLGQRLVPEDSEKLFAFRLVAHPVPYAETLSTGTIYVSTGLVALLDNEAQLCYVLAHEMAHVYKEHWKLKAMLAEGEPEYNRKQETKRAFWGLLGAGAGAALGAGINSGDRSQGAIYGAIAGGAAGLIAGTIMNRGINLDWDKVQEDEADKIAFKAVLASDYDVREVPKLYLALQNAVTKDNRVALGFLGNRKRVRERTENVKDLLNNAYKAEIELKQKQGKLVGDNPDYRHLMAELKRDNGILAYYYDMFDLAKNNLGEAVTIRSNDPTALYYYGKVMKLVARTTDERKQADQLFIQAAKYDKRYQNFGSHLHRALALMGEKSDANKAEIVSELQDYVNTYLKYSIASARGAALLPPNLDTIYDYMSLMGEDMWTPKLPEDAPLIKVDAPKVEPNLAAPAMAAPVATPPATPAVQQQPQKGRRVPVIPNPLRRK